MEIKQNALGQGSTNKDCFDMIWALEKPDHESVLSSAVSETNWELITFYGSVCPFQGFNFTFLKGRQYF